MTEPAEVAAQAETSAIDDEQPEDGLGPRRGHGKPVFALIAVAALLAFVSIFSVWINRQLFDTDNWVNSSTALLQNSTIRSELSQYLVDQVYANVDVAGQLQTALKSQFPAVAPLAGPAASALHDVAQKAANQLLVQPGVQEVWASLNRAAHAEFLRVLDNKGKAFSTGGGVVTLNVTGLLTALSQRLGIASELVSKLPPNAGQITILKSDELRTAQGIANLLRHLPLILVGLTLLLFALGITVAWGWRREALRACGWALILAGVVALVARAVAGNVVVDGLVTADAVKPAAHAVWSIETGLLVEAALATIAYGVVIVLGAWLAGPTAVAVGARRELAPHLREARIAYGALGVILLLLVWWGPTPATRQLLTMVLLAALAVVGFEVLRRQTAREYPDAERAAGVGRYRQRIAGAFGRLRSGTASAVRATRMTSGGDRTSAVAIEVDDGSSVAESRLALLERLSSLRDSGVLDEDEFQAEKRRILADTDLPRRPRA
jgi:Short C-terminal domain